MGFSRQEYWNGLPYPPPGDLPDPGIENTSLMSPVSAGEVFTTSAAWEIYKIPIHHIDMCCFLSGYSLSFGDNTPNPLWNHLYLPGGNLVGMSLYQGAS